MFADLNLVLHSASLQQRREALARALSLGWGAAAVNSEIQAPFAPKQLPTVTPLTWDSILAASPLARSAASRLQSFAGSKGPGFRQLRRVTVLSPEDDDACESALACIKAAAYSGALEQYDVVAVRAHTGKALAKLCGSSEVDLITLDLTRKLPSKLRFPLIAAAVQRGIFFELTYGPLLDEGSLRQAVINGQALMDVTRGKNLILSSAASDPALIRSPLDCASLASLFRMHQAAACRSMSDNCWALLEAGRRRRTLFKGALHLNRLNLEWGEQAEVRMSGPRVEAPAGSQAEPRGGMSAAELAEGKDDAQRGGLPFSAVTRARSLSSALCFGETDPGRALRGDGREQGSNEFLSLQLDDGWETVKTKSRTPRGMKKDGKGPGKRKR